MPKASPAIVSFNSGEFSPHMAARSDLKYYPNSCKRLFNFIPTVQGPAKNRPGTRFMGAVKNHSHRGWLRRFVFSENQAYIIEFCDFKLRFFVTGGQIESSPGVPYEVTSPFSIASLTTADGLFALKFVQSGDVLYITSNGQYPTQKLTRISSTTFTLVELPSDGWPFEAINPDQSVTVYASAATGASITLTASAPLFTAAHVGNYILLEQKAVDAIIAWEPVKAVAINAVRKSDGKNYKALAAGTTGAVKPIHSYGARFDGDPGVQWQFLDPGYGWAEITGYTDSTHVTASVISRIPDGAVGSGNATNRWAFSVYSDINGHPDNITFFRERLTLSRGLRIDFSVAGDFENFKSRDDGGLITRDMAANIDITSDESNAIMWVAPMSSAMLVGTAGEEYAIDELSASEAFGPGNIKSSRQSKFGSRYIDPAIVGAGVMCIQKSGKKLRDIMLAESVEERWTSSDATVMADHILGDGVIQIAHQSEPRSMVWCVRSDGKLAAFTIDREQDVKGWHPHGIGGDDAVVESIDCIPTPTGDELWMIVKRTINGSTKRYIEKMTNEFGYNDNQDDSFFIDSGLTFDGSVDAILTPGSGADVDGTVDVLFNAPGVFSSGSVGKRIHYDYTVFDAAGGVTHNKSIALITSYVDVNNVHASILSAWPDLSVIPANGWRMTVNLVSGLDHLEGETVSVCADGGAHPPITVVGGAINLESHASKIHAGLPYVSVLKTSAIEAGAADGTAQGKTQRISVCVLHLLNTAGIKYGANELSQLDDLLMRDASDNMDIAPRLFTGQVMVSWPEGYDAEQTVTIIQDKPLPATIIALFPQITTQDAR